MGPEYDNDEEMMNEEMLNPEDLDGPPGWVDPTSIDDDDARDPAEIAAEKAEADEN